MTKVKINGYKVHGNLLIPNGVGPRKAYILRAGYLATPVTTWWGSNANIKRLLSHMLKTHYNSNPGRFYWRATFRTEGKSWRETVDTKCATYQLASYGDGCYPLIYLTGGNDVMCAKCATEQATRKDREHWPRIVDVQPYYEGPPEQCSNCNTEIESAYGDPDADKESDE